ncbi:hypothetical protein JYU34_009048 [Plutella xylostella]|uniref:Uncharacterized protein n=1 Tax=Plutella xylostella TaxID=51655 RepID=A0ABQ7QMG1_PLUXY|nr:hypothetical protein JYU34_009048 [Plutella xylostella]
MKFGCLNKICWSPVLAESRSHVRAGGAARAGIDTRLAAAVRARPRSQAPAHAPQMTSPEPCPPASLQVPHIVTLSMHHPPRAPAAAAPNFWSVGQYCVNGNCSPEGLQVSMPRWMALIPKEVFSARG